MEKNVTKMWMNRTLLGKGVNRGRESRGEEEDGTKSNSSKTRVAGK